MNKKNVTLASVTLTSLILLSLIGCQKNSYESCIEVQTETASRQYKKLDPELRGNYTLQEYIDWVVADNCAGVK